MTKHKYAEIFYAIAEGKDVKIEGLLMRSNGYTKEFSANGFLSLCNSFHWAFRLKPEPKPDVVSYLCEGHANYWTETKLQRGAIKLTRSGETGEPIGVEILK